MMEQATLVHPSAFCWNPSCSDYRKVNLNNIRRVKGRKEETVLAWLRLAAQHVERIEAILLANYRFTRAQLDALWTYVGHKGEKGSAWRRTTGAPSGAA